MVTVTETVKFHQPIRSRRREWQDAMLVYRDTKQGLVDGWAFGDLEDVNDRIRGLLAEPDQLARDRLVGFVNESPYRSS